MRDAMRIRGLLLVLVTALFAVVVGCGGGGGGGASLPLDSTYRQAQPGDEWEYTVTGTASSDQQTFPVTGTMVETITNQTIVSPNAVLCRISTATMTLTGPGGTIVDARKSYWTQDASGTIWTYGGQNGGIDWWVISPVSGRFVEVASPMQPGISWSEAYTDSNAYAVDVTSTVVGQETISVPAGTFPTYRVTSNGTAGGVPVAETIWYAPQIGTFVQDQGTIYSAEEGVSLNLTMKLARRTRSAGD